jgi:hypothetical protein
LKLRKGKSADWEEKWEQWRAGPVGAIHKRIEDRSFLCGHENPFDGWVPFVRIIPLRIDSLVEVLASVIEVILGKCKEFINKVEVLLRIYFTAKARRARRWSLAEIAKIAEMIHFFWFVQRRTDKPKSLRLRRVMGRSCH